MRTFLICLSGLLLAAPLHAQARRWSVTIEAGELRFHGTSADTSSEGTGSFRPYRPTAVGLRLERGGSLRLGLGLLYGSGPAALTSPELTIAAETDPLTLLELAPTISVHVARIGGGAVRLAAGPVLDRWAWSAAPTRWRVGGEVFRTARSAAQCGNRAGGSRGAGTVGVGARGSGSSRHLRAPRQLAQLDRRSAWRCAASRPESPARGRRCTCPDSSAEAARRRSRGRAD